MFTISSTSSVHHRFVLSAAQVQFYRLFPCMLQLFTHSFPACCNCSCLHTHTFPACCNCNCLHSFFPCMLQLQLFTLILSLHAATAAVYTHTLSLHAATAAVYTHSFPACCNCSCLHSFFPCMLQLQLFTLTLFPCMLQLQLFTLTLFPCILQLQLFTLILSLHAATAAVYTHTLSLHVAYSLLAEEPCWVQGQRGQPFPHTSTHCRPDKCSVTRHSWQLHFHFRDFSGGVCQVMKTTTAESNPDMTVLLQQTSWHDSLATTNILTWQSCYNKHPDMTVLLQQTPCFSPKVLATDKMAITSWLQTTRWQPGYRQDGNHVMATDKMAIMSWLQTTRWQPCPGYRQDGNHVMATDKMAIMSWLQTRWQSCPGYRQDATMSTDNKMSWLQTRWQACPGYRQQDGNHVLATDKMAITSWLQTRWQSCPGYRQDGNHVLATDKIATMSWLQTTR